MLDASNNGASYLWNDGSTNQTLQVTAQGEYFVTITNTDGCSIVDSTEVKEVTTSNFAISGLLSACQSSILSINASEGDIFWSTGDTTPNILVAESGMYDVTLTNACGTFTDLVDVEIGAFIESNFLGNDTVLCTSPYVLTIDEPNTNVIWSDGDNSTTKSITSSNIYAVSVNDNGCISKDTVDITILDIESVDLGEDIYRCSPEDIVLETGLFQTDHIWSTGDTTSSILVENSGTYYVTVSNAACSTTDSIKVEFGNGFENGHFIPDAFSPNDDNRNDCLRVFGDNQVPFHLQIYNRDGLLIYETKSQLECWDGTLGVSEVPQGVYFYIMETQNCFGEDLVKKGELVLVR